MNKKTHSIRKYISLLLLPICIVLTILSGYLIYENRRLNYIAKELALPVLASQKMEEQVKTCGDIATISGKLIKDLTRLYIIQGENKCADYLDFDLSSMDLPPRIGFTAGDIAYYIENKYNVKLTADQISQIKEYQELKKTLDENFKKATNLKNNIPK